MIWDKNWEIGPQPWSELLILSFGCKARFLSLTHASKGENSISWHSRVICASYSIVIRKYIPGNCPATITVYFSDYFFLLKYPYHCWNQNMFWLSVFSIDALQPKSECGIVLFTKCVSGRSIILKMLGISSNLLILKGWHWVRFSSPLICYSVSLQH